MIAKIFISGTVGIDATPASVISQLNSYKNPTSIEVHINSNGGFVKEGMDIYEYLKAQTIPVTTIAERAWSIASVIYMAGDTRMVEPGEGRIMIHLPWGAAEGDARELRKAAEYLEQLEEMFTNFYTEHLSIDSNTIKNLLLNETYLNAEEAVGMGFSTGILEPIAALAFIGDNTNQDNMNRMDKFYSTLKNFFSEEFAQNLVIQDGVGNEIKFEDLELGETPSQGDKARIGSKPASGEFIMNDGTVYIFNGGLLAEIKEAEVEVEARAEASEEQVQEAPEGATEDTVEETVTEEANEEEAEVESPEGQDQEGSSEVDEALGDTGEQPEAETQQPSEEVNEQIDIDALISQLESSIYSKLEAKYKDENEALKTEIANLKKSIGSDVDVQPSTTNRQTSKTGGNFLTDALRGR